MYSEKIENLLQLWPPKIKIYFINFLHFLLKILTLFRKITSKNWFWSNVSLGWKSTNSLMSVLNTSGVVLSRNIGPKTWHPFGLLIPISTTVPVLTCLLGNLYLDTIFCIYYTGCSHLIFMAFYRNVCIQKSHAVKYLAKMW